jgi:serine/threonine protein phosphatase PrpC
MFSFFSKKSPKASKKEVWKSSAIQVSNFMVGSHEEKGRRPTMEDKVCAVELDPKGELGLQGAVERAVFFAVFDGHGGSETSAYLEHTLQAQLGKNLSSIIQQYTPGDDGDCLVKDALTSSFQTVDAEICKQSFMSGSTATTVLMMGDRIFCANIGDSRVVLSRAGKVSTHFVFVCSHFL